MSASSLFLVSYDAVYLVYRLTSFFFLLHELFILSEVFSQDVCFSMMQKVTIF